jgi:hypothetical protein
MSVTPSNNLSSLLRNLTRQLTTELQSLGVSSAKPAVASTPEVSAPDESSSATGTPPASYTDGFDLPSSGQQEWAAKFAAGAQLQPLNPLLSTQEAPPDIGGSTPVIKQNKDTDCGAATATMLSHSVGAPTEGTDTQVMDYLDSRFASTEGTTPRQLTDMLAHEGMSVTQSASSVDTKMLDDALSKGQKVVAMVDSNQIRPGDTQAPGNAHWVVVDGKNANGQYTVKDPGTGTSYNVSLKELTDAVNAGKTEHNIGGMMVVDKAQQGLSESEVAETSSHQSVPLGNKPGIGSNPRATFGRESS